MEVNNRQLTWGQGNVLTADAALALNLHNPENTEQIIVIVSHDCDLAAAIDKEPNAEIIFARRIDRLGSDSFSKTARRLQIEFQTEDGPIVLEMSATDKKTINKDNLFQHGPNQNIWLDGRGLKILQRWLAVRYDRAAFPEEFEKRLRAAKIPGKVDFLKKIENILSEGGKYIRAVFFDLDEGKNIERNGYNDVYQLGIIVLYDSSGDENAAFEIAEKVAEKLGELFESAFITNDNGYQNIELKYCDAISDNTLTVAEKELLKQWRLEHMSMKEKPHQPMISN